MTGFIRNMAAAAVLLVASAATSFGQVPTRTMVHFTIRVPVAVTIGNYALAPGTYVLYQDSQVADMFALYRDNMSHPPIAQILTTQTPYWAVPQNRETRVELRMTESNYGVRPVIKGFNVPFADRWNVVSVIAKHNSRYIMRIN
jgi:hypothetical protein